MIGAWSTVAGSATGNFEKRRTLRQLVLVTLVLPTVALLNGCLGLLSATSSGHPAETFKLSPTSVNFGQVVVGKQCTQAVTVSNTTSASLNITSALLSNSQFSISGMSMPMALASGQSTKFNVGITPSKTGNIAGTLTVSSDSGTTPVVVDLAASAVTTQGPHLSVSPASINFATLADGLKSTRNLVLSNTGSADLTVSVLTLTGADFTISGISTPKTIASEQSIQAVVTFSPTAAGSASGNISITSNDSTNPTVNVPLSGTGTATVTSEVTASPASLSFGAIAIGSSSKQQIVLTNSGNAILNISGVTANGTGYSASGLTFPTKVNPSQSVTITAIFNPTVAGNATGSLAILSDAGNSPVTIPLSGTGAQAGLAISPASFNFGSVVDGQTRSQNFVVTNTGTASLTIAQLSVNGGAYKVSGLNTPAIVAPNNSATFSVLFAPTTVGGLNGSVSVTSNAPNSPTGLSLTGSGVAGSVSLSANPTNLSFTSVNVGSSTSKNVTITNNGNMALTISKIAVNAKDFGVRGLSTPITLTAGQNAVMSVFFGPQSAEQITGNITVTSTQGASAVIPVLGDGVQPALTITPSSANFGNVSLGLPSNQTMQLTNSGTGTLMVTQVSVTGSGFRTGTLSLPISLNPGQSITFNVQFAPTSAGAASGSVAVVSNAPNSPAAIALSGTGVATTQALTFSITNLGFGSLSTGSSSTQTVTVTNTGNANVTVTQITESGAAFTLTGAGTPVTLSPGQNFTFSVVFAPSSVGTASGAVTVTSTATGSPKTIALSGTGVPPTAHSVTLNWNASTSTVSGYNVYRSTTSGGGYTRINNSLVGGLSYSDTTVQNATTYYYVATAVDSSGNESPYSNQASAVIP